MEDVNDGSNAGPATIIAADGGVNAYSVQVRWQATDTPILSAGLVGISLGPSSASSASPASSASISTLSATPPVGLSRSSKAVLGVGISLIVLSLVLIGSFIFLQRRRHRRTHISPNSQVVQDVNGLSAIAELEAKQVPQTEHHVADSDLPKTAVDSRVPQSQNIERPLPEPLQDTTELSSTPWPLTDHIGSSVDHHTIQRDSPTTGMQSQGFEVTVMDTDSNSRATQSGNLNLPSGTVIAQGDSDGGAVRKRLEWAKEERELLERINELRKLEKSLESEVTMKREGGK